MIATNLYLKTTVQHRCISCGKPRRADISAGMTERKTTCTACGTHYTVTRSMNVPGLINKK